MKHRFHYVVATLLLGALLNTAAVAQTAPTPPRLTPGYTYRVETAGIANKRVFVTCQRPINAQGELVGRGDLAAQLRQVFTNLQQALRSINATPADITQVDYRVRELSTQKQELITQNVTSFRPQGNPRITHFRDVRNLLSNDMLIEVEVVVAAQ